MYSDLVLQVPDLDNGACGRAEPVVIGSEAHGGSVAWHPSLQEHRGTHITQTGLEL